VWPGGIVPGLSRRAAAEEQLLTESGRDIVVVTLVVAVTAGLFAVMADHAVMSRIQRLDDAWLRLMISGRAGPLTALAKIFNILGLVYVTLPVRIAVAGFLAVRRQWWHLSAFAAAVVLSEALIGLLKGSYDRVRPPGSLVATSGASFPSGHAVAASVTVVAAVIALVPAGNGPRGRWPPPCATKGLPVTGRRCIGEYAGRPSPSASANPSGQKSLPTT